MNTLEERIDALSKLRAIVMYYRSYYDQIIEFGGCPILNIGVDTHHNNPPII